MKKWLLLRSFHVNLFHVNPGKNKNMMMMMIDDDDDDDDENDENDVDAYDAADDDDDNDDNDDNDNNGPILCRALIKCFHSATKGAR